MNPKTLPTLGLSFFYSFLTTLNAANPEAIEIAPPDSKNPPAYSIDDLPKGKEADGIIGDFVLRNDKVEAVISHNGHLRRANMSTFYGATGTTPGCLYDLTLRGSNNDQIVIFTPSGQQGSVSHVRIVKDGSDGEAVVETTVTAALNRGLFKKHEYILREGWQGVLMVTTFRNESKKEASGSVADRWTKFSKTGSFKGITWADSVDPADKAGYAYDWVDWEGCVKPPRQLKLAPGETLRIARFLAVGTSPAEAVGQVAAFKGDKRSLQLSTTDGSSPVSSATITLQHEKDQVPAYTDANGKTSFPFPKLAVTASAHELGRSSGSAQIEEDQSGPVKLALGKASGIAFKVTYPSGERIPCKVQFHGIKGTKSPYLGPGNRAHGCNDQYHSENGSFRVQLDPGHYRIVVTRGIEFNHIEREIEVKEGKFIDFKGHLKRVIQTPGWVSTDYHNHSTPSGDNTCGTDDRITNLAAEHIEYAPTTEHNRIYDWLPHIQKLGLTQEMNTVVGMELTGTMAHMNSFPLNSVPYTQDWGAPVFELDPRVNALNLKRHQGGHPDRWIHINHPDMAQNFTDADRDGKIDGGFVGLGTMIDAIETQNYSASMILEGKPYLIRRRGTREYTQPVREFSWLQNLNRGHRYWGIAVADAHAVYGNGVGGWRTYVQSSTDKPSELDWRELSRNSKNGRMILTTGPYLEVSTDDGTIAGGTTRANGLVSLNVKVQCSTWLDIDRVQVLVNGRPWESLNFTRKTHPKFFQGGVVKFERSIDVPLSQDAHLIVVAYGENSDLSKGFGTSSQAKLKPCAYNNPIFIDVDGGGFTPNGDTLGYPLVRGSVSVEEAKKMMGE